MAFYQDIVKVYDKIFPLNKVQAEFMSGFFKSLNGVSIVDAGCGTGSLAIEMGRRGASVVGFDLDADMISRAKEKCPQAINVKFIEGNLLDIDAIMEKKVNAIYCFGNTLVHLSSLKDIEKVVKGARSGLKEGGFFALQIVNYDRVLKNNVTNLPTIEAEGYTFVRNYKLNENNKIEFETILSDTKSENSSTQMVELLPIKKQDLENILLKYFNETCWFGSFKKDEWVMDSFHTIVVAKV